MIGSELLNGLACHLAWMEGKENGVNGMLAVLFAINNRVKAGWENGDLGRILQAQYYLRTMNSLPIEIPDVRDPGVTQLLSAVEPIFEGTIVDRLTNGALWWGEGAYVSWGIKPHQQERVAQVGSLILYK